MRTILAGLCLALLLAACSTPKEANRGSGTSTSQPEHNEAIPINTANITYPDFTAVRLDSLVAISNGDYLHVEIGTCFGKCDARVSIFRTSPAKFYIYEAEAWRYDEFDRDDIRYRSRRPMANDQAEALFQTARELGLLRFVNDTTMVMTDMPHIWVRARLGGEKLSIDKAYLGGKLYTNDGKGGGLADIYTKLRVALLAPLFNMTGPSSGGK
ncbi:MAG: hypothetical protein JST22_12035 [Bacteroidetes bacterium]|nr:hypothetical protein [Bacteroidota bacterium]